MTEAGAERSEEDHGLSTGLWPRDPDAWTAPIFVSSGVAPKAVVSAERFVSRAHSGFMSSLTLQDGGVLGGGRRVRIADTSRVPWLTFSGNSPGVSVVINSYQAIFSFPFGIELGSSGPDWRAELTEFANGIVQYSVTLRTERAVVLDMGFPLGSVDAAAISSETAIIGPTITGIARERLATGASFEVACVQVCDYTVVMTDGRRFNAEFVEQSSQTLLG